MCEGDCDICAELEQKVEVNFHQISIVVRWAEGTMSGAGRGVGLRIEGRTPWNVG